MIFVQAITNLTVNKLEQLIWDAQLLRSILLELGLTKETSNEKQRSKLQRIIALRKFIDHKFSQLKKGNKGLISHFYTDKKKVFSSFIMTIISLIDLFDYHYFSVEFKMIIGKHIENRYTACYSVFFKACSDCKIWFLYFYNLQTVFWDYIVQKYFISNRWRHKRVDSWDTAD